MAPQLVGSILGRTVGALLFIVLLKCALLGGIYCNFLSTFKILLNSREAAASCARNFSIAIKSVAAVSFRVWELFWWSTNLESVLHAQLKILALLLGKCRQGW